MKMGTIASPWRYDAAARIALQFASLRCFAIHFYAFWIFPGVGGPVIAQEQPSQAVSETDENGTRSDSVGNCIKTVRQHDQDEILPFRRVA
jgi:hypothetical protein